MIAPAVKVLPWNNHRAAVSLTFDDGDSSHLDTAIPELDRRGLKGTFFVVSQWLDGRAAQWQKAFDAGHELANHSARHPHPQGLTRGQLIAEVDGAKATLEELYHHEVLTYAYPYTAITPELRQQLDGVYVAARGGGGQIQTDADVDWLDIKSVTTLTKTPFSEYLGWLAQAQEKGAWCVVMIHGIEGTTTGGWEPIAKSTYSALLDEISGKRDVFWTATFAEVASYLRAQKEFEKVEPRISGTGLTWTWTRPRVVPAGVVLKMMVEGEKCRLMQGDKELRADDQGIYAVAFDAGELAVMR